MNEEDITEALEGIHSIHSSLNETNAMTFVIFLTQYKDKLCDEQINWVREKIDRLNKKASNDFRRNVDKMDMEISLLPLNEKIV